MHRSLLLLVVIDFPDCVINIWLRFINIQLELASRRSLQSVLEPLRVLEFEVFLLLHLWLLRFLFFEFADLDTQEKGTLAKGFFIDSN
jgi:hypothetical protein